MNFVFDILKKYGFHCSSVAFAESGATLVGRNTDLIPWIAKSGAQMFPVSRARHRYAGKLRYVHVTPGLFLGVLGGFNERGMGVVPSDCGDQGRTRAWQLATPLLQRMILEEATDMAHVEDGNPRKPRSALHQRFGDVKPRGRELHLRNYARIDQGDLCERPLPVLCDPFHGLGALPPPTTQTTVSATPCANERAGRRDAGYPG